MQDVFSHENRVWVGFEWYREILWSSDFTESLCRSLFFSFIVLILEIPLGIIVALSMPKSKKWLAPCLIILALPLVIPWNLIPVIWKIYLQSNIGSLLQNILAGELLDWKFNPLHTWLIILLMDIWHWTSLVTLLCYSSLSVIPEAYYHAACIDGASRWQVFRFIELPKMRNVLFMALLLRFVDSFMLYTEAFRFNAGGPGDSTMFLAVDLGEDIFAFNYGPSAARSIICFLIILTVAWIFFQTRKPTERYT
ncbi:ABC transporter permease [Desulforhopalus sp. 52FAK]